MNGKRKNRCAILLSLMICLSFLAGCQNVDDAGSSANDFSVQLTELPKSTIEGFDFADGMERSVCVTLSVESIQRGEEAFKVLQEYDTNITPPNEKEEYIIVNFIVLYDSGEIEELYMMENRASLEQAGLYFALSNGRSNAYDMTSYLSNSIYDISLTKGQSAQGAVAFLQEKGNMEPLVFIGFEKSVEFDINPE